MVILNAVCISTTGNLDVSVRCHGCSLIPFGPHEPVKADKYGYEFLRHNLIALPPPLKGATLNLLLIYKAAARTSVAPVLNRGRIIILRRSHRKCLLPFSSVHEIKQSLM